MSRALISVFDKTGLAELAHGLADLGWTLVSSGGTAAYLQELGLEVTPVEDVTGAPEMLSGRVKTLHPNIHGGILARRDLPDDMKTIAAHGIEPFDLVCVNLYPFTSVAGKRGVSEADVVEMIDVGGPSMLRAAAKNFAHVAVVTSPEQYDGVLAALRAGELDVDARRNLARDAFAQSAAYDAAIATWFAETDRFPDRMTISLEKVADLSYGENPHQGAAYYRELGARRHLLSRVEQLGGKELSYNNLADLEGARRVIREFELPSAVIVKHANPCGVAVAGSMEEAYEKALASEPVWALGCVLVLKRPV
jgi:phosphoribosylaminoimidazolecarboxamide formyltransferase/IMP cyclohydrolase